MGAVPSTPAVGGQGGNAASFVCNPGTWITAIEGRAGDYNDGIQFTCNDGKKSPYFGGQGGVDYHMADGTGFSGSDSRGGQYVDQLTLHGASGTVFKSVGGMGGNPVPQMCPTGQVFTGANVRSGDYLDNVVWACGVKPTSTTTATPIPLPPAPSPAPPVYTQPASSPPASSPPASSASSANQPAAGPAGAPPAQAGVNPMIWVAVLFFMVLIVAVLMMSSGRHSRRSGMMPPPGYGMPRY